MNSFRTNLTQMNDKDDVESRQANYIILESILLNFIDPEVIVLLSDPD